MNPFHAKRQSRGRVADQRSGAGDAKSKVLPEIRVPQVPDELLRALGYHEGTYCELKTVFHCLRLDMEHWVGVAGDGANGGYEQFVWKHGLLTVSDVGWGSVEIALLKLLQREVTE